MCGRYASTRSREDLLETFEIEEALADEEKAPDYNVAPTKTSPTVLARLTRGADDDAEPVRQLRNLKWGHRRRSRLGTTNPQLQRVASDAMKERGLRSSWVPGGCWGCSRFTTREAP